MIVLSTSVWGVGFVVSCGEGGGGGGGCGGGDGIFGVSYRCEDASFLFF
jgi:hypothetical protein